MVSVAEYHRMRAEAAKGPQSWQDVGSAKEVEEKRRSKYGNEKVTYFNVEFDSKKEGRRYLVLVDRIKKKEISRLRRQPLFILVPAFQDEWGTTYRMATYRGDFIYWERDHFVVEDVKSAATSKDKTFIMKWKLVVRMYPYVEFRQV